MNSRQSRSAAGGVGDSSSESPQYQPTRDSAQQEQSQQQDNDQGGLKRFFKDMSWAQIIASGLSAITVFLLSAKIGLAGSIIGAALASIISTVTSQLYRNVLDESSKRVKNKFGDNDSDTAKPSYDEHDSDTGLLGQNRSVRGAAVNRSVSRSASSSSTTSRGVQTSGASHATTDNFGNAVAALGTLNSERNSQGRARRVSGARVSARSTASAHSRRVRSQDAPNSVLRSSHVRKQSRKAGMSTGRKVVLVAIVSALIALGVVSGIIMLATHGNGTDAIVRDAVSTAQSVKKSVNNAPSEGSASTSTPDHSDQEANSTVTHSSTTPTEGSSNDSTSPSTSSPTPPTAKQTGSSGSSAASGSTDSAGLAPQQSANQTGSSGSSSSSSSSGSLSQKQNDGSTTGSQKSGSSTGSSDSGSSDSGKKKDALGADISSTSGNSQTNGSTGSVQ